MTADKAISSETHGPGASSEIAQDYCVLKEVSQGEILIFHATTYPSPTIILCSAQSMGESMSSVGALTGRTRQRGIGILAELRDYLLKELG